MEEVIEEIHQFDEKLEEVFHQQEEEDPYQDHVHHNVVEDLPHHLYHQMKEEEEEMVIVVIVIVLLHNVVDLDLVEEEVVDLILVEEDVRHQDLLHLLVQAQVIPLLPLHHVQDHLVHHILLQVQDL